MFTDERAACANAAAAAFARYAKAYPDATAVVMRALGDETRSFVDNLFWNGKADLRNLLVSSSRARKWWCGCR